MDGISVKSDIHDVELNTTHVFTTDNTFLGCPLESRLHGVTDFVEVLDTSSLVTEYVGAASLWAEAPELTSVIDVPAVFVDKDLCACFWFLTRGDVFVLNGFVELFLHWLGGDVETVMLVGGFGKADLVR